MGALVVGDDDVGDAVPPEDGEDESMVGAAVAGALLGVLVPAGAIDGERDGATVPLVGGRVGAKVGLCVIASQTKSKVG